MARMSSVLGIIISSFVSGIGYTWIICLSSPDPEQLRLATVGTAPVEARGGEGAGKWGEGGAVSSMKGHDFSRVS